MPKASRKELRKSLFKKGAEARQAQQAAKPVIEKPAPVPTRHAPKRYILFVGNLPYNSDEAAIRNHFKACEISKVRLRSNGICFLEFEGENAAARLYRALQFHHTMFENRKINVEFSAGGGGNSKNRRDKIKQKNEDFQKEMTKKTETKDKAPVKNKRKTEKK